MKTPAFWKKRDHPLTRLFMPAGAVYAAVTAARAGRPARADLSCPVICVGNLTVGGSGKTPVCLSLCQHLKERALSPHFLTRGYGGALSGVRVNPEHHNSRAVGDEALLLARNAPTWVFSNRAEGGKAAQSEGADVVIMDDGHQNPALKKDLSLVVVDGQGGLGNGCPVPAGPLREWPRSGFARADAVIVLGPDRQNIRARIPENLPILLADIHPVVRQRPLKGQKLVAFAGIGRPEKFFESLSLMGGKVLAAHPFADHFPYAPADIQPILDEAFSLGAIPVTTEKDAVRLPPDQRQQIDVVGLSLNWHDPAELDSLLKTVFP